eukprot:TRINITY_DN32644_c0_g1_i1.p1 TRINITY_DN32644_c0_g1~~TRINITY_DN32644_c0_g1_i1.p1  ORF type:complete len:641 (-),score=107.13 TRINITY_DN32644_c0_g1_i1:43-1965(-)
MPKVCTAPETVDSCTDSDSDVEVTYEDNGTGQLVPPRDAPVDLVTSFELFVSFIVFVNFFLLGVELDHPGTIWRYIEQFVLMTLIIDTSLRLSRRGLKGYLSDRLHFIDIAVIFASSLELWILPFLYQWTFSASHYKHGPRRGSWVGNVVMPLRGLRLLRVFRILNGFHWTRPLYRTIGSMGQALLRVSWVGVLMALLLYCYALIFTQLLGKDLMDALDGNDELDLLRARFNTVPRTFFELFRALCGDVTDLGSVISAEDNVVVPIVYAAFQVSTTWMACSVFTAEVVDATIHSSMQAEMEERARRTLDSWETEHTESEMELRAVFTEFVGQDNGLDFSSLAHLMKKPSVVSQIYHATGLTSSQVIILWESVEVDGVADLEEYVDSLLKASHMTVDSSLLRMQALIQRIDKFNLDILHGIGAPRGSQNHLGSDMKEMKAELCHLSSAEPARKEVCHDWQEHFVNRIVEKVGVIQSGLAMDLRSEVKALQQYLRTPCEQDLIKDLVKQVHTLEIKIDQVASPEQTSKECRVMPACSTRAPIDFDQFRARADVASLKSTMSGLEVAISQIHAELTNLRLAVSERGVANCCGLQMAVPPSDARIASQSAREAVLAEDLQAEISALRVAVSGIASIAKTVDSAK